MDHTIVIKLPKYLREYVFNQTSGELVASKKNLIGQLIKPYLSYIKPGQKPVIADGDDFLTMKLVGWRDLDVRSNSVYMNEFSQREFKRVLELHFRDVFIKYMSDKTRYLTSVEQEDARGRFKSSIIAFCIDYGLSFDAINYETLKKIEYRHRKKIKTYNNNMSSFCPLNLVAYGY